MGASPAIVFALFRAPPRSPPHAPFAAPRGSRGAHNVCVRGTTADGRAIKVPSPSTGTTHPQAAATIWPVVRPIDKATQHDFSHARSVPLCLPSLACFSAAGPEAAAEAWSLVLGSDSVLL